MPITSASVLRKMNEIQSKGGEPIGHWHQLRQWLKETEQVQENFLDAVMNDPDMSDAQKEYWLNPRSPTLREAETPIPAASHGTEECTKVLKGVRCKNCGTFTPLP